MHVDELVTPALLIDRTKLFQNIRMMAEKARQSDVMIRPHIKTHKCLEIGRLQLEEGATGITVSTIGEALAFIEGGFSDITLAFPPTPEKIPVLLDIAERATLKIIVDNPSIVAELEAECTGSNVILDVLLKVDCGYHRCGVDPAKDQALSLVQSIENAKHLRFRGILTHAGHAYNTSTVEEIAQVATQEQETMVKFAELLQQKGLAPEVVSIGSTPTCMITEGFKEGITEIRPGNYVFFDATQAALGACELSDCALTVLTSVVSVQQHHIVVDAGATTLSKDAGATHILPEKGYGVILSDFNSNTPAEGLQFTALSQEHGKIRIDGASSSKSFRVGHRLRVIPNHTCLAANLSDRYYIVDKDRVTAVWAVQRQRFAKDLE
jgi:D-serine deaminase-like pyridoxal phosphate-dependent protein